MNANGHQVSLILTWTTLLCINPERTDELLLAHGRRAESRKPNWKK